MASADKCHHTMSFLQYVPDQKPGLSTCTLLVLPAYRAIISWAHFSHCRARQTPLKLPVPGELDSGWLGSTQKAWWRWRKGEMGNPRKLQQRGIQAGTSSSLFQWCDPGWVFTSQMAALSCAVEKALYNKASYIYSLFNTIAGLTKLPADIMLTNVFQRPYNNIA